MTSRAWLPHPARTIPAPDPCPAGTRYTSQTTALTALRLHTGDSGMETAECWLGCGGWHIVPRPR